MFKTIATSKMKLFVALVCGFQPSTNVTKSSILGIAGVLDRPSGHYFTFPTSTPFSNGLNFS